MKPFLALALAASLGACSSTGGLTPQAAKAFAVACNVDEIVVPLAQPLLLAYPPASVADAVAHPLVVAACAQIGGTPVSAVATAAPALSLSVTPSSATVTVKQ